MVVNYPRCSEKILIRVIYIVFLLQLTALAQTTYTWNGNIANWNTSTEWTPTGVPGGDDTAIINAGQVQISSATNIKILNLNYGGIDCGEKLQIFDGFSWTGGYFENGGDTVLVHSTAAFDLSGSNSKSLGCVLVNETICTWSEGQFILDDDISRFINNSVFDIQIDQHLGNSGRIINNGLLKKTVGSGETSFGSSFYNYDSVDIQTGTLKPTGYVTGPGSYNIAEGAVFLSAGTHRFNGNVLSGEGIFEVQSAYTNGTTIAGAGLAFPLSLTFKFTNGFIEGDGPIEINGPFTWSGTFETGADTVWVRHNSTINGAQLKRVLVNEDTCTCSGSGLLLSDDDARFINNSVFDIQIDQHMGNNGRLVNNGIIKKTAGSGITSFASSFYNYGSVDIQTGTLKPTGYVTGSGAYNIAEGAVFLSAGNHRFNGNVLSGEGIFEVQSAYTSGTTIAGAGLVFPLSLTFNFTNGFIKGDGPIEINGPFTCSGIFETGADTVWVRHKSTITGGQLKRVLVNEDTCTCSGSGLSLTDNNARFINNSVFDIQTDRHMGNSGRIINNGILKKTAGSGTSSYSNSFTNNGLIEIQTGTLSLRGYTKNSSNGIISGIGTFSKPEGTFNNQGSFSPGLSPGLLTYTGNFSMTESASYDVEFGGQEASTQYDQMDISGTATLNGNLNIALIDGFIPAKNDTFRILNYARRSAEFVTVNCPNSLIIDVEYETDGIDVIVKDINNPPETISLIQPADGDTIASISEDMFFLWQASEDDNPDSLSYTFRLFDIQSDTTISDLTDTSLVFDGSSFLGPETKYEWTVLVNDEYSTVYSDTFHFFTPEITDIKEITGLELPKSFSLKQNYPNPFNPETAINYLLPINSKVEISIYNISGQKVETLVSKKQAPGNYTINWDASGLSSGVYIYLLKSDDRFIASKKMILLR